MSLAVHPHGTWQNIYTRNDYQSKIQPRMCKSRKNLFGHVNVHDQDITWIIWVLVLMVGLLLMSPPRSYATPSCSRTGVMAPIMLPLTNLFIYQAKESSHGPPKNCIFFGQVFFFQLFFWLNIFSLSIFVFANKNVLQQIWAIRSSTRSLQSMRFWVLSNGTEPQTDIVT